MILISALISSTLARGNADDDGHELQIRLISLPAAVLMFFLATLTAISLILNGLEVRLPFHMGSVDAGCLVRPAIFYIVEDVVAVDGNGAVKYREAFGARYDSSEVFQGMIWTLSVVWMASFYILAAIFTALTFTLPAMATYAVGWAGPFPLAGLLAIWTIHFVKSSLRKERNADATDNHGNGGSSTMPQENERTPLLNGRA